MRVGATEIPVEAMLVGAGAAAVVGVVAASRKGEGARDLSRADARALVGELHAAGTLRLLGELPADPAARIVIAGDVDGVRFDGGAPIDNLDTRFAVALSRLATFVRRRYGATQIRTYGVTHGIGPIDDAHNEGRGLDLAGLVGRGWSLDVFADWGRFRAPYAADTRATVYRLGWPPRTFAAEVWASLYAFAARECADVSDVAGGNDRATSLAAPSWSRFIVHPDHPNPALRLVHADHMHMQIGPTRGGDPTV